MQRASVGRQSKKKVVNTCFAASRAAAPLNAHKVMVQFGN